MKFLLINHHLFQEGDAYGLIYSLLLSKELGVGDNDVYALYYVNMYEYANNIDGYKDKVRKRMQYFSSFGLLGSRVLLVFCSYSNEVPLFRLSLRPKFIHIRANEKIFKRNPRLISLLLTGAENDPSKSFKDISTDFLGAVSDAEAVKKEMERLGKEHPKASEEELRFKVARQLVAHYAKSLDKLVSRMLVPDYQKIKRRTPIEVNYAYISKSTDYVAQCVRERGFVEVTKVLRAAILTSTADYTKVAGKFLDNFMEKLVGKNKIELPKKSKFELQTSESSEERTDFIIVLFWIRGAKKDEHDAIFNESGGSVGKPQHHTNLALYKYVRGMIKDLSEQLGRPFLFVPIGDELKELTTDGGSFEYTKRKKDHNLIGFFNQAPFKDQPMGVQMNFLLQLSTRYPVIQIGMRSGSMERLMYLGVPTIYFDRTEIVNGLPNPVGATRIRQLCGFQGTSDVALMDYFIQCADSIGKKSERRSTGFPLFFHIENKDTGFLRYSDVAQSKVSKTVAKLLQGLDVEEYNKFKRALIEKNSIQSHLQSHKNLLYISALNEKEMFKLALMLWFMSSVYPPYRALYNGGSSEVSFGESEFSERFEQFKTEKSLRQTAKQQLRSNKSSVVVDLEDFNLFGDDDEEVVQGNDEVQDL